MYNKSDKVVLSSLIIARAGLFKSSIMKDIIQVSGKDIYQLPDQPTERGIIRLYNETKAKGLMKNKIWTVEDAVTCFPSLEDTRQNRLVNLFVKVLMDGSYSYADFSIDKKLETRAGLYVNIADQNFQEIKSILKTTTFLERTIPFRYAISKQDEIKVVRNFGYVKYSKPPKVKFKRGNVDIPFELAGEVDVLNNIINDNCEMSISRSNMFCRIILRSIAILEGRDKVLLQDIELFRAIILPYLSARRPILEIERAMILMLSINRKASFEDCVPFFSSDICKNQFPYECDDFIKIPIKELRAYFTFAQKIIKGEETARDLIGDISGKDAMLLRNNQPS